MCLIIASVFGYLSFSFYTDGSLLHASLNGAIALFFVVLMIRNIKKAKAYKREKETH